MEKQDLLYGIGALVIIIIIALVVKPMVTGQQINTGLPISTTKIPPTVLPTPQAAVNTVPSTTIPLTIERTPSATPVPTWDKKVAEIVFVDPSLYGLSINDTIPKGTRIQNVPVNTSMTTFAKISGQYSGTSQMINIPFPYWELWYTVEPAGETGGQKQSLSTSSITGSKQSGEMWGSASVMQGSYSVVIPQFTVQVMDGNDPNRIVRTITPPGGIDKNLWYGGSTSSESDEVVSTDPRPWKEKFYEGERSYFFVINAQSLSSYSMEFRVPTKYVDVNASAGTN